MAFAPSFSELLLQWGMNIGSPGRLTTFYVALNTGDPGTDGSNQSAVFARVQHDTWSSGGPADGTVQNSGIILTGAASGDETVTHFSVWSAVTGGTYYFGDALDISRDVITNDTISFADGAMTVSIT